MVFGVLTSCLFLACSPISDSGPGSFGGSPNGSGGTLATGGIIEPYDSGVTIDDISVPDSGVVVNNHPKCSNPDPCACIRVGTIGIAGTWGNGNLFKSWLAAAKDAFQDLGDQVLTPDLLSDFQIIISQDLHNNCPSCPPPDTAGPVHLYTDAEIKALQDWIHQGNGFFSLVGYWGVPTAELTNINRIYAPIGLSYDETPILPTDSSKPSLPITSWFSYPDTAVITDGITAVGFNNGYPVAGSGNCLAKGSDANDTYCLLRTATYGTGHVVAWGDEWITYDSDWTRNTDYQVGQFWQNIMQYVSPVPNCKSIVPDTIVR